MPENETAGISCQFRSSAEGGGIRMSGDVKAEKHETSPSCGISADTQLTVREKDSAGDQTRTVWGI